MSRVPPSARDGLLPATLHLYRISFRRCFPVALIGALGSALIGAYAALRLHALIASVRALLSSVFTGLGDLTGLDATGGSTLLTLANQLQSLLQHVLSSPATWASYLGASLITLACHGVLIGQQSAIAAGDGGVGDSAAVAVAVARALRRLPSLLLVALLLVLANALASGIADWLTAGSHYGALMVLMLLAAWLWGRLQLWLAAMFSDDVGALESLQRSWQAVRGHWWYASAATTVPYLLVFGLSSLAALIAAGFSVPSGVAQVMIGQAWLAAASILALPILPALWVELYRILRPAPAATPRP